jgi:hypothetical protein
MTVVDDVVLDFVATVARPAARPADTKAAISYLISSGATAISIIENVKGCSFKVGSKLDPRAAMVFWLPEDNARAVMRKARTGASPDIAAATTALHKAAADQRVTLTEHGTAMMRAGEAAKRLDAYVASLRARGAMKEFTKAYRRHRLAAIARGEGFMSYAVAELRLRRALVPLLVGGRANGPVQSLFAEIFGTEKGGTGLF